MTKRERAIKDRFWLRQRRFAVTRSLVQKLGTATEMTDRDREYCCYIQNKVLHETRKNSSQFANIGAKYWSDKCGGDYGRWIVSLKRWGELEVNEKYRKGTVEHRGFTKSYRVPFPALESGVTKINFERRMSPIKDRTRLGESDSIIRYVHGCSSQLTVPERLVDIDDPIQWAASHEYSCRVFAGNFNIRFGKNSRRLIHSIIEMTKESRANLIFKEGGLTLYDYDVRSCHPVLLLPLFQNAYEKAKFSVLLDNDIYSTIRSSTNALVDRREMKILFSACIGQIDRTKGSFGSGPVYVFLKAHFPVFTNEVLNIRSDLAIHLQNLESDIMVQEVGHFCMKNKLFWIPCHDGWLGTEEGEKKIQKQVFDCFNRITGYPVHIKKTILNGSNNNISTYNPHSPSYVRIEPTSDEKGNIKRAEDWFAGLPKHPEPDPQELKAKSDARLRQRLVYQGELKRRVRSERLARDLRPHWKRIG